MFSYDIRCSNILHRISYTYLLFTRHGTYAKDLKYEDSHMCAQYHTFTWTVILHIKIIIRIGSFRKPKICLWQMKTSFGLLENRAQRTLSCHWRHIAQFIRSTNCINGYTHTHTYIVHVQEKYDKQTQWKLHTCTEWTTTRAEQITHSKRHIRHMVKANEKNGPSAVENTLNSAWTWKCA